MNTEIYDSIIFGSLYPNESQLPENYSDISHLLNTIPDNLKEIEERLHQILNKNLQVNFDANKPINTNAFIDNPKYTPVIQDYYSPDINVSVQIGQSPIERYYSFIISAEAKRIKLSLIQYVDILQDNLRAKSEIKDTLKGLSNNAKKIATRISNNNIFDFMLTQIVKLYFEITIIFDALISEKDYISITDFYALRLNRQADNDVLQSYTSAVHIHQAQQLFLNFNTEKATNILSQLYIDYNNSPTETLATVICAIENAIFLTNRAETIPDIEKITNIEFVQQIVREQKSVITQRYERKEIAIDRANTIDEIIPELNISKSQHIDNERSIIYSILNYLKSQKELYLKNPSAVFKVEIEKQSSELKKKPQPTIKPMQIKTKLAIVHNHLAFLDGVNPKNNERIMSEKQYKLLVSYVEYLVQYNEIPKITQKIHNANLPKTWFKYTIYLIHQELYNSIQDMWIEFIQKVFDEYSPNITATSTLKTKFSVYPSGYSQFHNTVNS